MKHLKLFFALFAMLALGVGNAWGAEWTHNFSKQQISTNANDTLKLTGIEWSVSNATYVEFESTKGVQIGSSKKPQKDTAWTISTPVTNFGAGAKISKVEIEISTASKGGMTYTITAGDQTSTETLSATTTVTTKSLNCEKSPVSSGEVKISLQSTQSKAVYIKSIKVTYTVSSDQGSEETVVFSIPKIALFGQAIFGLNTAYLRLDF